MAKMVKFVPRVITAPMAAKGYNNEGRGKLIGYIADPTQHEITCRYRITTGGNKDKWPHESCTCRIGLWQEPKPRVRVKAVGVRIKTPASPERQESGGVK